jgi:hypothetical protein
MREVVMMRKRRTFPPASAAAPQDGVGAELRLLRQDCGLHYLRMMAALGELAGASLASLAAARPPAASDVRPTAPAGLPGPVAFQISFHAASDFVVAATRSWSCLACSLLDFGRKVGGDRRPGLDREGGRQE